MDGDDVGLLDKETSSPPLGTPVFGDVLEGEGYYYIDATVP